MKTILDVSNIVYGGYYGSPGYRVSGFPAGGLRKILGIINADIRKSEFIICFDGGAILKRELLPTYKAGRVPNYAVMAQIDLLKEILVDCNIPFYQESGFEADDFICSVVDMLSIVRDPDDVVIYSDDRDIACCVSSRVSIKNVTTNGISITRQNYEDRVVSGQKIPFNTILLYKIFFGDKSDNYPGVILPGVRFDLFAKEYLDQLLPLVENDTFSESAFFDIDIIDFVIDSLSSQLDENARATLKAQARIVFPQRVDVTTRGVDAFVQDISTSQEPIYKVEKRHMKVFGNGDFNSSQFDFYCNIFGLNRCRPERYSSRQFEKVDEFKNLLSMRAKDLASGVMAVEKYQKRKAVRPSGSIIANMQLPT